MARIDPRAHILFGLAFAALLACGNPPAPEENVAPPGPTVGEVASAFADAKAALPSVRQLERFTTRYPNAPQAREAHALINAALAHRQAWSRARLRRSIAGYEEYLKAYPEGANAKEAREQLEQLRRGAAWQAVVEADAVGEYRRFAADYPAAPEAKDATARAKALETIAAAANRELDAARGALAATPKQYRTAHARAVAALSLIPPIARADRDTARRLRDQVLDVWEAARDEQSADRAALAALPRDTPTPKHAALARRFAERHPYAALTPALDAFSTAFDKGEPAVWPAIPTEPPWGAPGSPRQLPEQWWETLSEAAQRELLARPDTAYDTEGTLGPYAHWVTDLHRGAATDGARQALAALAGFREAIRKTNEAIAAWFEQRARPLPAGLPDPAAVELGTCLGAIETLRKLFAEETDVPPLYPGKDPSEDEQVGRLDSLLQDVRASYALAYWHRALYQAGLEQLEQALVFAPSLAQRRARLEQAIDDARHTNVAGSAKLVTMLQTELEALSDASGTGPRGE